MFDHSQLWSFGLVATLLVIVPGPNTLLIVSTSLTRGRRAGVATVFGIETGTIVHAVAAGLGISRMLAVSPFAFDVVKYAGAVYLVFLGVRALATPSAQDSRPTGEQITLFGTFRRALVTCLLNPKAAVFFLALLPQFVRPERGYLLAQFVVLGGIVAAIGAVVGVTLSLAMTAGAAGSLTAGRTPRWQARITGCVLLGLGARLALT